MKKISLDLDDLQVESFATTPEADGIVQGYSCPSCVDTCDYTCGDQYTCVQTCSTCPPTDCSCPPISCIGSSGGYPCP